MPNKATAERQKAIAASGITPLDYMLAVVRDTQADPARRDEMAKAAAPYVHPKLASVNHGGKVDLSFAAELAAAEKRDEAYANGIRAQ